MSKIGIYLYRFEIVKIDDNSKLNIKNDSLGIDGYKFFEKFITDRTSKVSANDDLGRAFKFSNTTSNANLIDGVVEYGTFGFGSQFLDQKTSAVKYNRATSDVEVIPLYFCVWISSNSDYGILALQSFEEKSCVTLLTNSIIENFKTKNPSAKINKFKLMPQGDNEKAKAKRVIFRQKSCSTDFAEKYIGERKNVDMELVISSKRNGLLPSIEDIKNHLSKKSKAGIVEVDGVEFNDVAAEVKIGNSLRRVNVLGFKNNSGVIDISEDVTLDTKTGHPTLASIKTTVKKLISDICTEYGYSK